MDGSRTAGKGEEARSRRGAETFFAHVVLTSRKVESSVSECATVLTDQCGNLSYASDD